MEFFIRSCVPAGSLRRWQLDGLRAEASATRVYLVRWVLGLCFDEHSGLKGVDTHLREKCAHRKMLWVEHPTGSLAQPRHVLSPAVKGLSHQ